MTVRNRIKEHRRVRAGDLVPHEFNWRQHPNHQREALLALYAEVGFARSLLAYQLPDGRLKLIDGHLRRDLDPDMEVDVEILDVSDDEARKLLLSIDPLVGLAETDRDVVARLQEVTETDSAVLAELWQSVARGTAAAKDTLAEAERAPVEQFLVLVQCRDEAHQRELLDRFQAEGLAFRALVS